MSETSRRFATVVEWDRDPGKGLWPGLNSTLAPAALGHPAVVLTTRSSVPASADPPGAELVGWYQQRFAQCPPTPEQLSEWEGLARRHRADPENPFLCQICRMVFPCLLRTDAHAALVAARGDEAEFDADPLVRLTARVLAAQRAGEGYAAVLLPLLEDARQIAATHRPDPSQPGLCGVCRDQLDVGDDLSKAGWPCGLYRLAAALLRRAQRPRPAPDEQSD